MIWLQILLGTVILVMLFRCMYHIVVKSIGSHIERRHRAIEHILETHEPPAAWLAAKPGPNTCIKRLDRLLQYASQSNLVADEQTRGELVDHLEAVRTEWATNEMPNAK